jgi:hypothetical protein
MSPVRSLLTVALSLLLPAAGGAAEDAARCQSAFVHGGTGVFDRIADVTARCYGSHLRSVPDPEDEGCPSTDQFNDFSALETKAITKIDAACTPALGASGLCTVFAAEGALDLVDGAFGSTTAFVPNGAARRCRAALGASSVQLAKAKARVLRRCNENALRGLAGYGPLGPTCESRSGTQAAIADAEARVRARIAGKCGSLDPQTDLGLGASCTGAPYCEFAIDTLPDAIDCVACIAHAEVDQLSRGLAALPLDAGTSCEVGRAFYFLDLVDRDLRDLGACEDRIVDGNGTAPCPDAETADDIQLSDDRYAARLAELCPLASYPDSSTALDLATIVTDTLFPTHAEETDSGVKRCRIEIGRSVTQSSGNVRRHLRALRSCHTRRLCGQTSGVCPDSEASASIARGAANAANGITTRCGSYTPSSLGFGASCPALATCGALPNTTIPELIACLQCITDAVVADALAGAVP